MIKKALKFAEEKHKIQYRKVSGEPYIFHPLGVAGIIRRNKDSHKINELVSAAILHDTLEDTDTTEKELRELFGDLITSLVKELTTDAEEKERIGKKEYLAKKMSDVDKMSSWALVIKLADRLDNLSDLKECSEKFREKYSKETLFIIDSLEKNRELSKTHKRLIKKIRKKLDELK